MMGQNNANTTCLVLLFMFLVLFLLLVYLYRRLNRDTNGQYTIRKLVLEEGGLRDQVRSGIVTVETRLGVHLWPRPRPSSDEEEVVIEDGQPMSDRDVETGQSLSNNRGEGVAAQGEGEQAEEGDDSDDDYSSMDGTDLRERAKLMKDEDEDNEQEGERRKEGEGDEEKKEREEDERKEKNTESLGLLVNLQELSGSAIWSEEKKDENEGIDLTAL